MRKQYHFQPGAAGLRAWDVGKLIEHARGLPVVEVPLAELRELDEPYWYRTPDALPTCRSVADHWRLAQAADLSFPVLLGPDGRVLDGMHRVTKALMEGCASVRAYRLATLPEPDYVGVDPGELPYDD